MATEHTADLDWTGPLERLIRRSRQVPLRLPGVPWSDAQRPPFCQVLPSHVRCVLDIIKRGRLSCQDCEGSGFVDAKAVLTTIQERSIEVVDLRIVDLFGMWHHFTIPVSEVDEAFFEHGVPFDGSSLRGFRTIDQSDMVMLPDPSTAHVDPFAPVPTLAMVCDVREPGLAPYDRDPRTVAARAEAYLAQSGIADTSYWGPELEFFIFDTVAFGVAPHDTFYAIDSGEGWWTTGREGEQHGYQVRLKQGYAPLPPHDATYPVRAEIVRHLQEQGIRVEMHHHEVATAGQAEIDLRFNTLKRQADTVMLYKYTVKNTARRYGKTATFMPKPLFGDNGSGMHVHQSLWQGGRPLFFDPEGYAQLSKLALSYIAGVLYHAPALLAFTNPTTNSYRRLVPGYEAPVNIVFSKGNRSAAVRIPITSDPKAKRIEFRTPDPSCNPYLAFAAVLLAGLDGIKRGLNPVDLGFGPVDKNIYELSEEERQGIQSVPGSLDEALAALERDHDFLLAGGVFTEDLLDAWCTYKRREESDAVRLRPHPMEFALYFDA
jgi:glutamine synthetase